MSRNKDLAAALSDKHGLNKQDAEKFVAAMFALINDSLEKEKVVKVKGLGTFKVVSVAPRKSVDVNTGKPIVIEGRDKITFAPDANMRDEVNKPFAQFDTVVVNDGVDFSEIDKKFSEEVSEQEKLPENEVQSEQEDHGGDADSASTPINPVPTSEEKIPTETEPHGSDADSASTPINPIPTSEVETPTEHGPLGSDADLASTPINSIPTSEEETPTETESLGSDADSASTPINPIPTSEEETPTEQETIRKEEPHSEPVLEESNSSDAENELADRVVVEEAKAEVHSDHRALKYIIAACAAVVIICIVGAVYMFLQLQKRDDRIANLEAQVLTVVNKQKAKDNSANANNRIKSEVIPTKIETPKATVAPSKKKIESASAPAPKKVEAKEKKEEVEKPSPDYDKDPRVRTGAYNIVGIDKSVTVKAGQTLSSISRFYYGPGMECYVEAVNGGRTDFAVGDKINLPQLKHKKAK